MEREINFYFPNHLSSLTFYEQKKGKQRRTDTHGNSRTERGFGKEATKTPNNWHQAEEDCSSLLPPETPEQGTKKELLQLINTTFSTAPLGSKNTPWHVFCSALLTILKHPWGPFAFNG